VDGELPGGGGMSMMLATSGHKHSCCKVVSGLRTPQAWLTCLLLLLLLLLVVCSAPASQRPGCVPHEDGRVGGR
jgi:hypothetical protein